MKKLLPLTFFLIFAWLGGVLVPLTSFLTGNRPIPGAEASKHTLTEPTAQRLNAIMAAFDSLDMRIRPEQPGKAGPRDPWLTPAHFKRESYSQATDCIPCHYLPFASRESSSVIR